MPFGARGIKAIAGLAAVVALLALASGSGCLGADAWTEVDAQGNSVAWTIAAQVQGGYSAGVAAFAQVTAEGSVVSDPIPDATGGHTYEYSGEATSYPLRILNRQSCSNPCGFVRLLICPTATPQCTEAAALKNLGIQEVKAFTVAF